MRKLSAAVIFMFAVTFVVASPTLAWDFFCDGPGGAPYVNDSALSIRRTSDGGFVVAGFRDAFVNPDPLPPTLESTWNQNDMVGDFVVVKYGANGVQQWVYSWGQEDRLEHATDVYQTTDGGYIAVGFIADSEDLQICLMKLDAQLNAQWTPMRTFGLVGTNYTKKDIARSVIQTLDGKYLIAGKTMSYGPNADDLFYDAFLMKITQNGDMDWVVTYGLPGYHEGFYSVKRVNSLAGGFIAAGFINMPPPNPAEIGDNVFLVRTEPDGDVIWGKNFGDVGDDRGFCVQQIADGSGFIVAGWAGDSLSGADSALLKTDNSGNLQWYQTFPGTPGGDDKAFSVAQTSYGCIVSGYTTTEEGDHDFELIKVYNDGRDPVSLKFGGTGDDRGYSVSVWPNGKYVAAGFGVQLGHSDRDMWIIGED